MTHFSRFLTVLLSFCVSFILFFLFTETTYAFIDEFSVGFSDPSVWEKSFNSGVITFDATHLRLTNSSLSRSFPYVRTTGNIFPLTGPLGVRIDFNFLSTGNFGDGIAISPNSPPNGTTLAPNHSQYILFLVWQDKPGGLRFYTTACPESNPSCSRQLTQIYTFGSVNYDSHYIALYMDQNGKYHFYLDSDTNEIFTSSASQPRPVSLWFGSPEPTNTFDFWNSLQLEKVETGPSYPFTSPTSTPTPTPSPTPEPTPEPLQPIIVLPGLGASWDFPAILGGTSGTNWSIPSFVNLYDNLISSLIKAGYEKDKNLFVFAYDWRKDLDSLATDLDDYIDSLVAQEEIAEGQKIDFVGHSYGGLVTRAYGQRVGTEKINKIVMAGSPHQGILDAYATWEGATVWKNIWWQKAALELQTQLNQRTGENRVDTVRRLTPGIKDVLPTFDFLKKDGVILLSSSLNQKNTTLADLNSNIGLIDSLVNVNGGNGKTTDRFVKITQRGWLDRTLGLWEDGKPISDDPFETSTEGDDSVLSISSLGNFTNKKTVSADHGGVVNDSVAIGNIFDQLGLDKTKVLTNVIPDQRKNVFIAALRSPGSVSVCDTENICDENLGIYLDEEKIFLLPGYNDGDLNVMVVGQGETGSYRLHLGDLADDSAAWETVSGKLESGNQVDQYDFSIEEGEIKISVQEEVMQRSLDELYRQLNSLWPNWDKKNLFATVQSGSATKNKRVMAIRQLRELLASLAIKAYKERKIDRVEMIMVFWKELDRHAELVIGTGNSTKVSMLNANISLVGGYKVLAENLLRNSTSLPAGNFYLLFSRRFDEAKDIRSINRDLSLDKTLSARYLLQTALGVR